MSVPLTEQSGHWGNLRRLGAGAGGGIHQNVRARIPTMCERRSAALKWAEGRQDVRTIGHAGRRSACVAFSFARTTEYRFCGPVHPGLNKGSRWESGADALTYLCECAEELGHVPYSNEVVGGTYISQRFGGWGMAIYCAGLPELKGVKGPTAAEKAALRGR